MSRTAEIRVTVELDDENLPTTIHWEATEANSAMPVQCQSMMLSLWDSGRKTTAAIDLWTKDTTIDDMNLHFHQLFRKMSETYLRATKNSDVAGLIDEFGDRFGEALGLS